MVIVVVGVLATGLSFGIKEAIDLYRFLSFHNEIASQARLALTRMGREIRQMTPRRTTFEPIQVADSNQLRFTIMDLDGDGNDDTLEFYRDAANNELRRIFNDNPTEGDVLASNVSNLLFTYYDENNTELATPVVEPSDVYRVVITLTLTYASQTITMKSQIYPRNL